MHARGRLLLRTLALTCLFAVAARAQFYAPETDYHDPVQRVFPVEAARVLAWLANAESNTIAEVSYSVSTTDNGTTSWQLAWLDAAGKPVKTAKVEYAAERLKAGPGFYREVMRQLGTAGWGESKPLAAPEAIAAFWRGAQLAEPSREESLKRAFLLAATPNHQAREPWMPQLAGLLVHAALPRFGAEVSLDNVMVARGSAWLALTERACAQELPDLWVPPLFLAGREQAAAAVWNRAGTNRPVPGHGAVAAWDLWLKNPTTKQTYLFAADLRNLPVSMAMMAYDVRVNASGRLLAEVIGPMVGSPRALAGLHNYALLFALSAGVGGGHIMNGTWPFYQRDAWVDLLAHAPAMPEEGVSYEPTLREVAKSLARLAKPKDDVDACLLGFKETAPLIQMGQKEGVGKLVPTAVATARDLLNYGWEMTGLQMGARYHFVNAKWDVPEYARPVLEAVTGQVQGLYPFFKNAQNAHVTNYQECLQRLQQVSGHYRMVGWTPDPFQTAAGTNVSAFVFAKRCWLRPELFDWQARSLWGVKRTDQIAALVDAVRLEEGPLGAFAVLSFQASLFRDRRATLPRADEWTATLAERLPEPTRLYVSAVWEKRNHGKLLVEVAKDLERLYWQNPDSGLEDLVFLDYAKAGTFGAARRFYVQSRENLLDPVWTSSGLGHYAFVLGYLMDDAAMRRMALEDSASGSYNDMVLHIWDAAIRDDRRELERQLDELIERYDRTKGPTARGARLKRFLPLLPALAKADAPLHQEALDYFKGDANWVVLRWIWIQKFKLSKDDAIAFLGGREADTARHVLVCYLEGDPVTTLRAVEELLRRSDAPAEERILATYLYLKLAKDEVPDVPDLKPADATSARTAVLARLKAR